MNKLLKGLLAQDPSVRLTAEKALLLPVFDDFRGSMLPHLEPKAKAYEYEDNFDTLFEDDILPMGSIKSLESRSRMFKASHDGEDSSLFSVRYEGQDPAMYRATQMKKPPGHQGKTLSQKSNQFQSSNFHSSQASDYRSGSQMSWKDEISPLTSPQVQLRMLNKQQSEKTVADKKPEGLVHLLVSPPKTQSNMHIEKRMSENKE